MKIIATNLRQIIDESNLSIFELVRRLNTFQERVSPEKRKITRSSIYQYFAGHTPSEDKIYMLAAILNTTPKKIFTIFHDDQKMETYKNIAKELFS